MGTKLSLVGAAIQGMMMFVFVMNHAKEMGMNSVEDLKIFQFKL